MNGCYNGITLRRQPKVIKALDILNHSRVNSKRHPHYKFRTVPYNGAARMLTKVSN